VEQSTYLIAVKATSEKDSRSIVPSRTFGRNEVAKMHRVRYVWAVRATPYDQALRAELRELQRKRWSVRRMADRYKVTEVDMARQLRRLGLLETATRKA
jgi:hypothetical protein